MLLEDWSQGRCWTDNIEEGTRSYLEKFMMFCTEDQIEKDISVRTTISKARSKHLRMMKRSLVLTMILKLPLALDVLNDSVIIIPYIR